MKKISFITIIIALTASLSFAQTSSTFSLGTFENLKTIVDKKTNKERPMTKDETKAKIITDMSKKLTEINSTRKINIAKIAVLETTIIVPLVEADGTPFYSVIIDRKTGLTDSDLIKNIAQEDDKKSTEEWNKSFIDQEKRMDETKKAVIEYRKKVKKPTDTVYTRSKEVNEALFAPKK